MAPTKPGMYTLSMKWVARLSAVLAIAWFVFFAYVLVAHAVAVETGVTVTAAVECNPINCASTTDPLETTSAWQKFFTWLANLL